MKNIILKNIAQQVELSFLSPDVLGLEKVPFFGHFISKEGFSNYSKTTLMVKISSNTNEILDIIIDEKAVSTNFSEDFSSYKDDYAFLNEYSMSDLLRTQQLKCHTVLTNDIVSEIMFFEVEALCKDFKSYLFFGFADTKNSFVKEKNSQIFYKNSDAKIEAGEKVFHKTGSPLTDIFNNHVFGFGKKLKCHGSSPKKFIDGNKYWMKLVNEEDEQIQKKVAKIFSDSSYLEYLKKLNIKLQQSGYPDFWQTKEQTEKHEKIVYSIIQEL